MRYFYIYIEKKTHEKFIFFGFMFMLACVVVIKCGDSFTYEKLWDLGFLQFSLFSVSGLRKKRKRKKEKESEADELWIWNSGGVAVFLRGGTLVHH